MSLKGLQRAWFIVYSAASSDMATALASRRRAFGILVCDDEESLRYQYAKARRDHAGEHLLGPSPASSWSSRDGDTTERDRREWRRRRIARKRRARHLLKPVWEREEYLDSVGA